MGQIPPGLASSRLVSSRWVACQMWQLSMRRRFCANYANFFSPDPTRGTVGTVV